MEEHEKMDDKRAEGRNSRRGIQGGKSMRGINQRKECWEGPGHREGRTVRDRI